MFNYYTIAHAHNAANAHAQDSDRVRWSRKVSPKAIGVQIWSKLSEKLKTGNNSLVGQVVLELLIKTLFNTECLY